MFRVVPFSPGSPLADILSSLEKISTNVMIVLEPTKIELRVSKESVNEDNAFVLLPVVSPAPIVFALTLTDHFCAGEHIRRVPY